MVFENPSMPNNNSIKQGQEKDQDKDRYDFTNLSFEELFRVPVAEMVFQGKPLGGPDFFDLDFFALQKIPFVLSEGHDKKVVDSGNYSDVTDDSFDFLSLSFEELFRVPVKLNIWQQGDSVPEPDIDSLSLEDLMKLPVRRAFLTEMDPNILNKLLGGDSDQLFSDSPLSEGSRMGQNNLNAFFEVGYGSNSFFTPFFQPIDNTNNASGQSGSGGVTNPSPFVSPQAVSDNSAPPPSSPGAFYAIKSFGFTPFSQNTGNLINNDIPGTSSSIKVHDILLNNGTVLDLTNTTSQSFSPLGLGGTLTVNQDGTFSYIPPPETNNPAPGSPIGYAFSYRLIDTNNLLSNYATVNIKLYDAPVLSINDVQIIEGASPTAVFTVTLKGAIPIPLTITYGTHDGSVTDHIAVSAQDYNAMSGSHTFNDIDPTHIIQTFTISVPIINDSVAELLQKFYITLGISGTFVNIGPSDLIGEGAISDPDKFPVNDIFANGSVYEAGLSTGSQANDVTPPSISQNGNLLTGQNFGQIPLSGIDISQLMSSDQSGPAVYDNLNKTWTLTGDYFELVVYREDTGGHLKGDYVYTLTGNVHNTNNADFLQTIQFDLTPIDPGSLINQSTRTSTGSLHITIVDDTPLAQDDTGVYYAIKGSESGNSSGNLLTDNTPDIPGADRPLSIVSFMYGETLLTVPSESSNSIITNDGGTLTVYSNGSYTYVPPAVDNETDPGSPDTISFSYTVQDTDGTTSNAAVDIRLYDQPKIEINSVQVIEGEDLIALFTVTLTGAIPNNLTIHYSTQDGTALAGEDYEAILNGSHTFTDLNPSTTSQSFTISVNILDDDIAELIQNFSLNLDVSGTYVNSTTSVLVGNGDISDTDALTVSDVTAAAVFESGLSPDGSESNQAEPPTTSTNGNLLSSQNFGQIPLSNIDITGLYHPDESGPPTYDNTAKTWTLSGSYFELVVYREDIGGHLKGDYVYTLQDNVTDPVPESVFIQSIRFDVTPIDPDSIIGDQGTRTGTGNLNVEITDDSPQAIDDTGIYYAVKGSVSNASDNLLTNDITGADTPLKIYSITYTDESNQSQTVNFENEGSVTVTPLYGGSLTVYTDGNFDYVAPPADNDAFPGAPSTISFSYGIKDADGTVGTTSGNVDIKLYDQPIIHVDPVTVTEGTDSSAGIVVTLIGQIPEALTIEYITQDNTAVSPDDYTAVTNGSITFSDTNLLSQQTTISIPITDDTVQEFTEDFSLKVTSGPVNFDSTQVQNQVQADVTIVNDDVTLLEGSSGNDIFIIDMGGEAASNTYTIVIKDFGQSGSDTIHFNNVVESGNDSVIDNTDVAALISSVQANSFDLVNGTHIILENFPTTILAGTTPADLLTTIENYGQITINTPP